jgi:hypothetical protein
MVLQCVTVPAWLIYLYCLDSGIQPAWVMWTAILSLWAAVIQAVYSGLVYVVAAVRLVRSSQ